MSRADWILRPILWFVTASTINVILHEGAHALTTYAFGIPSTLFQYWVTWQSASASAAQQATIGAAGPVFSLIVGVLCLVAYRPRSTSVVSLPLLYLSTGGIAMFFGNLMSTAFVGDFSAAADALGLPMPARYAVSLLGALASCAILFWQGRELRRWIPQKSGRVFGVIAVAVLPILFGTAIVILVNQPVPTGWAFVYARATEASLGICTIIGAAAGQRPAAGGRSFRLWWTDGTFLIAALLVVRIMARGIPLTP